MKLICAMQRIEQARMTVIVHAWRQTRATQARISGALLQLSGSLRRLGQAALKASVAAWKMNQVQMSWADRIEQMEASLMADMCKQACKAAMQMILQTVTRIMKGMLASAVFTWQFNLREQQQGESMGFAQQQNAQQMHGRATKQLCLIFARKLKHGVLSKVLEWRVNQLRGVTVEEQIMAGLGQMARSIAKALDSMTMWIFGEWKRIASEQAKIARALARVEARMNLEAKKVCGAEHEEIGQSYDTGQSYEIGQSYDIGQLYDIGQ